MAAPAAGAEGDEQAYLRGRIAALEERALRSEEQLSSLRSSFAAFAAQSKAHTSSLLRALNEMAEERRAQGGNRAGRLDAYAS